MLRQKPPAAAAAAAAKRSKEKLAEAEKGRLANPNPNL
jgi:hypothetical protein